MINARIKIHMAGARVVKVVNKETVLKWKRCRHRRERKINKATIITHTDLFLLTDNQRKEWYREAIENKHPVMMDLQRVIQSMYPGHNVRLTVSDD